MCFNKTVQFNFPNFIFHSLVDLFDPKNPAEGIRFQVSILKNLGLWPPETGDRKVQLRYTIWSITFRVFFLYAYTATQVLFLLKVEDLTVVSKSFAGLSFQTFSFYRMRPKDFLFY